MQSKSKKKTMKANDDDGLDLENIIQIMFFFSTKIVFIQKTKKNHFLRSMARIDRNFSRDDVTQNRKIYSSG